ncbi:MAG: lysine--tRNA ligase [Planctomycetota bacterium]
MSDDLRQVRIDKIPRLKEAGLHAYPERFERTHTPAVAALLAEGTGGVSVAGRVMAVRTFGKLTFVRIQDSGGTVQLAFERETLPNESWKTFHDLVDIGDFIGALGAMFITKKGENTLRVESWVFLGKTLLPLPEKWHGLKDIETKQRRRYLDLVMSEETRARFRLRTKVVRTLRAFLDGQGFEEVDTPVLEPHASGAAARPFYTHHNALDRQFTLRIAPETWLKRLIAGGYDRVYEFARCFRNEGMDPSHLQEFTMLEYYASYWNWEDNLRFTERMFRHLVREVCGSEQITWRGQEIDFSGEWPRVDMRVAIRENSGIDVVACETVESLRAAIREKNIEIERIDQLGRGNLIDALYKATVRDGLIQPCFLVGIPSDILPLARRNDDDPTVSDAFQLLVNGWEIVKAYSELVDPREQRRRFEEQDKLRRGGDDEAMPLDENYLLAMEHGMPPISGWGMGLERLCALLSGVDNLREVTLFPLLKPEGPDPVPAAQAAPAVTATDAAAPAASGPYELGEFGLSREESMALFKKHVHDDYLTKHCLASAAVCEAVAEKFGKDKDTYWCMGLLHDLDFDEVKEPDKHTLKTVEYLKAAGVADQRILDTILSHNHEGLQLVERTEWPHFALSCAETITGLVMATAKVMPDKKLASVKASSVKKRMKKKEFARKVSREAILQCEQIDLPLQDFCALALEAMQGISDDLGL